MMDRYFVDIRSGCGAVVDRKHPQYDERYPGLHQDTGGVVLYKHGLKNNNNGGWDMREEDIQELQDLCDKLNVWPHRDKKLNELGI
jgi:hypothetical protein